MARQRTVRRPEARKLRQLVRDKERLAALEVGGSRERPIAVEAASVVEVRVNRLACPLCGGNYKVREHLAPESGIRQVRVICNQCQISRDLWFRLVSNDPS